MIRYDRKVISQFAECLEAQARFVVIVHTLGLGFLGAALGFLASQTWAREADEIVDILLLAGGALLGGLIGFGVGIDKAFQIRVRLHTLLCQVQIEENTRANRPERLYDDPFPSLVS